MLRRYLLVVVLLACALLSAAEWEALSPEKGETVFKNETGTFVYGGQSILPMARGHLWLKKVFPLDKLPVGVLAGAKRAKIRLYCNVADYNWGDDKTVGLNEDVCLLINGHKMLFKSSDPRFPQKPNKEAPQHFQWVDIEFPVQWLKDGKLEVLMHKNTTEGSNDYFYATADLSVANDYSFASVDGGRTWTRDHACLKNGKGEYLMRLVLNDSGSQPAGLPGDDFATDLDITNTALVLQNGAAKGDKMIAMPGTPGNQILVPGSENINITEHGLTMSAILRFREPDAKLQRGRNMMMFYKSDAFFLGRTGDRFNFSLCADGKPWSQALIGGEVPAFNEWFHLAAVVERLNEPAQGNVGYNLLIYVNGELYLQKFLRNVNPDQSEAPVLLGTGLGGYDFCGDIAEFSCYNRTLNANEISRMAANASRVSKLPAGIFECAPCLLDKFSALQSQAATDAGRWLVEALRRSATTGADQDKLLTIASMSADALGLATADDTALAAAFNSVQHDYQVCISDEAMILMTLGRNRRAWPVAGMFDRRTRREVFAEKTLEFNLSYLTPDGKTNLLNSYSAGLEYAVVPLCSKPGDGRIWQVTWHNDTLEIVSLMSFNHGRLSADLTATTLKQGVYLSEVNFPRWQFAGFPGGKDILAYPRRSGMTATNPTVGFNYDDDYPGAEVPMQFSAYYDAQGNGLYFGYEEPHGLVNHYSLTASNGNLQASWKT
ncbi:MAG: LamG domain-containing protein, partial [Victivallales bacterium]|nr:LamG domain-containing protein [Victivallales bacterium]